MTNCSDVFKHFTLKKESEVLNDYKISVEMHQILQQFLDVVLINFNKYSVYSVQLNTPTYINIVSHNFFVLKPQRPVQKIGSQFRLNDRNNGTFTGQRSHVHRPPLAVRQHYAGHAGKAVADIPKLQAAIGFESTSIFKISENVLTVPAGTKSCFERT
jgi:hypothetical protein